VGLEALAHLITKLNKSSSLTQVIIVNIELCQYITEKAHNSDCNMNNQVYILFSDY